MPSSSSLDCAHLHDKISDIERHWTATDLLLGSHREGFLYFKVQVDHRHMTIPEYLCKSLKIGIGLWISTLAASPNKAHSNSLMSSSSAQVIGNALQCLLY